MATIKDLFKSQKKDLYGLSGTVLIESRGLINAPRGAALLTSSPDALADLIGNQIGGALGGNPNRVSDTIFKRPKGVFTKPITLPAVTRALLRDSVKDNVDYYIKPSPAPGSIFAKIKQGGSSIGGLAAAGAVSALNSFGSKKGINRLKENLKFKKPEGQMELGYGAKFTHDDLGSKKFRKEQYNFSKYKPLYAKIDGTDEIKQTGIEERKGDDSFDNPINAINSQPYYNEKELGNFIDKTNTAKVVTIGIKPYGKDYTLLFPGTMSGLSEDISNEITNFKYVGSPFNTYRYTGVERTIKFELKLYYTNETEKIVMITKVNSLKELMFPYDEISNMTYADDKYSQIAFSPNLIYLSIDGYYNNIFGIMDTLSVSVEDTVPWALNDYFEKSDDKPYPTAINISFGMKVIESPKVETSQKITRYRYNFDGMGLDTVSTLDFKKKELQKALIDNTKKFQAKLPSSTA